MEKLDVSDLDSLPGFITQIEAILKERQIPGIQCLINNAGISPGLNRFNMVKPEQMSEAYLTNVIAPLMLSKAICPLMVTAAKTENLTDVKLQHGLIVNMSSVLGSIAENHGR